MYCRFCGKEVGDAKWCPYCGAQQPAQEDKTFFNGSNSEESRNAWGEQINLNTPAPRTNGFSIAGLILSFFSPLLGLIFSLIGLFKSRQYHSGRVLAIVGIIVSIATFIFNTIVYNYMRPYIEQILLEAGYVV